jgi:outer membrane protein
MIRRASLAAAVSTAVLALAAAPASAETLRDALAKAYNKNPTLTSARASQRANDENVPIAKADGMPSAQLTGSYQEYKVRPSNDFTSPRRSVGGQLNFTVPVYQGGAVRNAVKAAETRVQAGVETLRATEASVFSQTVAAYMDVIRDEAIVGLNRENVKVLDVNLQATKDRFEVGDLTRTDIAQSQARLATAQSDLRTAEANLIASRETYIQLVGDVPVNLETPPELPGLPADPDSAVELAVKQNPDLLAAAKQRDAAKIDIAAARATRSPRLSLGATGGYTNYLDTLGSGVPGISVSQENKSVTLGVSATVPIYQGGRPSARIRQAEARSGQAIEDEIAAERSVVAQTRAAFASWRSSLEVIESAKVAVDANTLSLEGVRAENSVGNRTILDILNAEQELLNSQVQLVSAQRNAYVAGFTLLAAMGQAEARNLGLDPGGPLYDPTINYNRVKSHIWDWGTGPKPQPVATRTVDTPSQNPETTPTPAK